MRKFGEKAFSCGNGCGLKKFLEVKLVSRRTMWLDSNGAQVIGRPARSESAVNVALNSAMRGFQF